MIAGISFIIRTMDSPDITIKLTSKEFDSLLYCLSEFAKKDEIECSRAFPIIATLYKSFPKYRRLARVFTTIAKRAVIQ